MTTMTDPLQAFLTADLNVETDVFIRRLGVSLRIKALDSATLEKAREQATFGGRKERVFDGDKFKAILVARMVTNVDFGHADMLTKYNASDSVDCIRKALLPGEIERITEAGAELSGFMDDGEAVDEVKN
ncbi:phage tail assembly chaperone [Paenibacillus elgii]|uniref:phage tail assembly chaperone n=1 Tax=Paenibacillus elgii TaxID=189691 RepID=UPI000248C316|nr:hypothetical protein [Paenibacillus elgii]